MLRCHGLYSHSKSVVQEIVWGFYFGIFSRQTNVCVMLTFPSFMIKDNVLFHSFVLQKDEHISGCLDLFMFFFFLPSLRQLPVHLSWAAGSCLMFSLACVLPVWRLPGGSGTPSLHASCISALRPGKFNHRPCRGAERSGGERRSLEKIRPRVSPCAWSGSTPVYYRCCRLRWFTHADRQSRLYLATLSEMTDNKPV